MMQALRETIQQVPFNSFEYLLRSEGIYLPKQWGGNCIRYCQTLAQKLDSQQVSFVHSDFDKLSHYALILPRGKELFFMDASSLQREPIALNKVLEGIPQESYRLPFYGQESPTLRAVAESSGKFRVEHTRLEEGVRTVNRVHIYDLEQRANSLPEGDIPQPAYGKQHMLLRVVQDPQSLAYLEMDTWTAELRIRLAYQNTFTEIKESESAFAEKLEDVARALSITSTDLRSIFSKGLELYRREFSDQTLPSLPSGQSRGLF